MIWHTHKNENKSTSSKTNIWAQPHAKNKNQIWLFCNIEFPDQKSYYKSDMCEIINSLSLRSLTHINQLLTQNEEISSLFHNLLQTDHSFFVIRSQALINTILVVLVVFLIHHVFLLLIHCCWVILFECLYGDSVYRDIFWRIVEGFTMIHTMGLFGENNERLLAVNNFSKEASP